MATLLCALDDEIVAVSLQIEDVDQLSNIAEPPLNRPRDLDQARAAYRAELELQLSILKDRKHARDITQALISDVPAIAFLLSQDRQIRDDQRLARQMSGLSVNNEDIAIDEDALHLENAIVAQDITATGTESCDANPSNTVEQCQDDLTDDLSTQQKCAACFYTFPSHAMAALPCDHEYCIDCLKRLFTDATKDQSMFPPRCCRRQIPLTLISSSLSERELKAFQEASVEFTTTNRLYCSNKSCGSFVPPSRYDRMSDRAECAHCGRSTCIHCKGVPHSGGCPEDAAMKVTFDLAKDEGWQQCQGCSSLVELTVGCYHMSCKCGHQFCYLCGARWKTCTCVQFEEERLLERAAEVVAREAPVPAAPENMRDVLARAAETRRVANNLRTAHECAHRGRLIHVTGATNAAHISVIAASGIDSDKRFTGGQASATLLMVMDIAIDFDGLHGA
ncbi:hypothetical protein FKW77_002216 [Venturia effusa]|uniref:RBR-type E3 ubiquitin transferase n=1 Tax=Venturia effusa TaxID=50376 RepID=A0A517LQR9_9PEZI|nr:hypothetical protein FKW77_002216 [Venturia effusa]